uniref:Uncharacterized protein n=1 Tax=Cannabis sativa TaxID=3483 RepID=A0A803NK77_CANSA
MKEEEDEEEKAQVLPFGGYNEAEKPISKEEDVLVVGQDYIEEEYTEARPFNNRVPIERPIRIRDDLEEVARPSVHAVRKGKVVVVEDEEEDSFDENAPSLLVREGAPVHHVEENATCSKEEVKRCICAAREVISLVRKNTKSQASKTSAKNSKGANIEGPGLPRPLDTPPYSSQKL